MTPKRSIRNRSSFSPEPRQEFETDSDTQGAYYKPPALPITHLQPHQVGFKRHRTSIETEREGYSRAKYERELSRKIPKNTEWQVISPIADEQLKQILNIVQNKAIVQAAGSITNDIEIYIKEDGMCSQLEEEFIKCAERSFFQAISVIISSSRISATALMRWLKNSMTSCMPRLN
ncbi:hypothetical protein BD560DRAFT_494511 [Blakeslea trispora]|nr:hypothetical protein BD560DRAFT_494511 [Blakeslea trispora]